MIQSGCSTSYEQVDLPEIFSPKAKNSPEKSTPEPKKRMERPTECLICGLKANGYHYDVASCNGCKTFFRRTLLSEKSFECKLSKDCFDLTKRKKPLKCRACRHQKCIEVGMNPLAMEVDEREASSSNFKKLTKRIKEEESDEECQVIEVVRKQKEIVKSVNSLENRLQNIIDGLVYLEAKVEQFRKCSYNPRWTEFGGLEHLLQTECRISYADRYGPMNGWPLQSHQVIPPPENGQKFFGPNHHPDRKHWFFYNLMTTVEYAKTFMFFHRLNSRDKLILTRYVSLACMNLHVSYSSMVKHFEVPVQPDGTQSPFRDDEHYSAMVMSVAPLIRCQIQSIEYLLLKAICLCNPAVPDLSTNAQEIISKEREKYADALFDHCLRNRPEGPAHFAQLVQIVDVLERQQRIQRDLHILHIAPRVVKLPKDYVIHVIEDIMNC
uniref:Nuclear Hormone Receptor family n=2 Tax=Caenorhabditis tropicalis TaxID=1561998 RepID=A0A1I7T6J5_9PELO